MDTPPLAGRAEAGAVGGAAMRSPRLDPGHTAPRREADEAELLARYESYRRREGAALLSLVPREAVGGLYRRMVAADPDAGGSLERLARFCERLLPLPPFAVWARDRADFTAGHLDQAGPEAAPRRWTEVARRVFEAPAASRTVRLLVRYDGVAWGGHLAFDRPDGSPVGRTGEIFREASASDVVRRFRDLDRETLRAFLRSVGP